jgi:delta8-fatty-acid desaturase
MVQTVETSSVSAQEHSTRLATNRSCPELPLPQNYSTLPILTRQQITARIVSGQLLVIHLPLVYRIPQSWLKLHPGGDLAILHYVGRDASNEIEVYHSGRTVQQRMARWIVGKVQVDEEGWRDMVPPVQLGMWPLPVPRITVSTPSHSLSEDSAETIRPIDNDEIELGAKFLTPSLVDPISPNSDLLPLTPSYQHHLRQSHRRLHAKLHELDLMSPPPFLSGYGPSLVIYISLFLAFVFTYMRAASLGGYVMSAIFLGAWWHQITFVAHDAGHTGLTGDWYNDRVMGTLITNFMGGISLGWWADNHNVHHCKKFLHSPSRRDIDFVTLL